MGTEWWRPDGALATRSRTKDEEIPGSAVPFAAMLLLTLILLLSPQSFIPVLAKIRITLLIGLFAVGAHWWTRFVAGQPVMRVTREVKLAAALLGWAVVTIPLSEWPGGSLRILLDFYLKALIIFWLLSNTVTTMARLRTIAWGLSLTAVPLAATGVWHFVTQRHIGGGRIFGYDAPLTQNPNDLALMLNLIVPFTAALFTISKGAAVRSLLAGLLVLDVTAIVITFSRAGFLALLMSLIFHLRHLIKRGAWQWAILTLALGIAAIPILPSGYVDRVGTILNPSADPTGSAQVRWSDMRTAVVFVMNHPFAGAGLGMNILALNELRGPRWQPVHNVYLEYGADLGWPGLALYLLLLLGCIQSAAWVRDRCAGVAELTDLRVLAEATRITLLAFAISALFYPVAYQFYFYYFGALAVALGAIYEAETRAVAKRALQQ